MVTPRHPIDSHRRTQLTRETMAKWFSRKYFNEYNEEKRGVKVVYVNINSKKPNQAKNNQNNDFPTQSRDSIIRNSGVYYDQVDVVDVRTLKQDIKKLLNETNVRLAQEKLTGILQSVDVINKRYQVLSLRLVQYEERIKSLESKTISLNDKNKELNLKVLEIEQFIRDTEPENEINNNTEKNCGEPSGEENKQTNEVINADGNDCPNITTGKAEGLKEKNTVRDGEMKVKILLWQMKQKIKATYKYKHSKETKHLLGKQESIIVPN